MKTEIDLNDISMSKNDPNLKSLEKYDVEANIEEVDNTNERSVFKYGFTALSTPRNVRLSIQGVARIFGDSIERDEILNKDENDIPKILTVIYQELFPTFFLLSKTLNVSCPPHTIGEMGNSLASEDIEQESEINEQVSETAEPKSVDDVESESQPSEEEPVAQPTV
ncbi:hypothetical protein [Nitrosopumilus sp.]|uniref:hypothetical protein n=1 Tax=Nitrosopumilus sp. TaxID=2024843 RepID=UPI00260CE452|nr:hypothetical protein [Nitrosopumilus sp.]